MRPEEPAPNGGLQTVNIENLTPAQTKAINAGGTNNAVIGKSLEKRGIMAPRGDGGEKAFNYNLSAEFVAWENGLNESPHIVETVDADAEKEFADAMRKEEDETPTSENFELKMMDAADSDYRERFAEAVDADDVEAQKEILDNAAPLVLIKDEAHTYSGNGYAVTHQENGTLIVEGEPVRDPKETRYAHVSRWTDENLEVKYGILKQRLGRRTLLRSDRMQAERHCQAVENEMLARGLRP
jgi:hypothetical protein